MKTKSDKKVNQSAKKLNRQLRKDVFQDRFSVVQKRKKGFEDCHEYHVYLYEFQDKKCPERNFEIWLTESEIINSNKLFVLMNEFIVASDFWEIFDKCNYFKDKTMCYHCHEYVPYQIKKVPLVAHELLSNNEFSNKQLEFFGEQAYCQKCKQPVLLFSLQDEITKRNKERVKEINPDFKVAYFVCKKKHA